MNLWPFLMGRGYPARVVAAWFALLWLSRACAQPVIVSTVPPTGATGVSPYAPVVITFSQAMDTGHTFPDFVATNPFEDVPTALAWSAGNTVLTCTPTTLFPTNQTILWNVSGQNPAGQPLGGYIGGTFTTGSGIELRLSNAIWSGGTFAFDVASPPGQPLTVEYSSTLRPNQWQTLLTTNSPAGHVHIVDPHSSTNRYLFYRARTGT
jgi:hypothetical protein